MSKHDIIFIAADPWEYYRWRRRHHIAWNLAKNNKVLFVEPPLTVIQPFRDIDLNWKHLLNLGRLKYKGGNLYSYSPVRFFPLSLPGSERFGYYERDKKRIFKILKNIIRKLEFKNPILWVYFSEYQYEYYGLFNEKITVADWFDKYTAPAQRKPLQSFVDKQRDREDRILNEADIVFAVSEALAADIEPRNNNVHVIHQGVDFNKFNIEIDENDKRLKQIGYIKRPTMGFLGIMHFTVDYDLLNHIAEKKPQWSIMLIGRKWLGDKVDIDCFQKLVNRKNVFYMGELEDDLVSIYMKHVDVCLMPMKKIEFNRCAAHLKIWDYMALGKPIVAVNQGIKFDCNEFIKVANTKERFVEAIAEVLEEERQNGELLVKTRKEIAMHNSWENRVNQMMEIIDSHLNDKH
ncbi:MAG: glycosyltransferase group 1 [Candidatus Scalindua rubra]|uniref:Glycosyltransferase group 1 n=1 Tax=Candidatus Scalindua rubra TaxID=1872076 RepID=A0A1E3XG30_9BACT|nr:MAG: glycosyltransferase group 1 [Candidatus Scalindua rubra]